METQKGPYKDHSLFKGAIWVSMLVWGSVLLLGYREAPETSPIALLGSPSAAHNALWRWEEEMRH